MKRIYDIGPYTFYRNEQFMKDCVFLPYTFSKIFDIKTVYVLFKLIDGKSLAQTYGKT